MSRTPEELAQYYRDRADELRVFVDDMSQASAKDALLTVIREYEELARRAHLRVNVSRAERKS
jgi:hypothetical protein